MTTISPGSTSRTTLAPVTSSAGVSDASTQPPSSRPRNSGRNPFGSRTPIRRSASSRTNENAPRSRGSTRARARSKARPSAGSSSGRSRSSAATSSATTSLSLVAVPGSRPTSSARSAVLTRLPLCASANRVPSTPRYTGCAFCQVPDRELAGQCGQPVLVEHGGHQAHATVDPDPAGVAHGDTRGLLAAMLQRVQSLEGQVGNRVTRCIHPEYAARLFDGAVSICHETEV